MFFFVIVIDVVFNFDGVSVKVVVAVNVLVSVVDDVVLVVVFLVFDVFVF